ncbi:MAG TPA: cytochrome d ubiquinol oxidase subunit II [Armatimonadota bacterium]|jgi:cytochrome d ubiquinol oxidase subunit II
MIALQSLWFSLVALLLVGYTVLAGFDLGIGAWGLIARKPDDRKVLLNAIGPFWDGNQVWLISGGGSLFAAFPAVYASVFSGMYLALILVLLALVLRSVSIEFGSHASTDAERERWGHTFAVTSAVAILLFGVAFGNLLRGVPLSVDGEYLGTFFTLLNPFALLIGVLNLAMLATHGAVYLTLKTEGDFYTRAKRWARNAWAVYLPLALATIVIASAMQPHLMTNYRALPLLWAVPALALLAIIFTGLWNAKEQPGKAFAASSVGVILLFASGAVGLFPTMVPALGHPAWNLTALNSSSSYLTLHVMAIVALIGMPIVIGYTIWSYRVFRGKLKDSEHY